MSDVIDLLARLVACPSVNPNHGSAFESPYGESRLAELLEAFLVGIGAATKRIEVAPGRPNVIAFFAGQDSSRSLMLEAHSDTVQVDDMKIAPFTPEQRDGRLYGRGACDTKGSMAAMLAAMARVVQSGQRPPIDVYFVSTCDEEVGATGATALMTSGFRADAAIVGEPTDLDVVHAHKGVLHWSLRVEGLSAHSSRPERGVSAIYPLARIVTAIETSLQARLAARVHPLLGSPTVSVGRIQGGSLVNIVPSQCQALIDRRLTPDEDVGSATRELRGLVDATMADFPAATAELSPIQYYPPLNTACTSGIARLALAGTQALSHKARFVTAPWGSNAGFFNAAGIPAVLFGPGSIRQAHTCDEFIDLDALVQAVDGFEAMIRRSGEVDIRSP